jgi:serine O-acetyltransferase
MIQNKEDYKFYLEADRLALGINNALSRCLRNYIIEDVWKFERLLRKFEYYRNCRTSLIGKAYSYYLEFMLHRRQVKLSLVVGPNCFGPGLSIAHPGTLLVNGHARIGANCRIHPDVVIGPDMKHPGNKTLAPRIGNNVFIGPGAKIFGDITIADGISIGANSVVNKSFLESNITIAGIPARKVSNKGSKDLLIDATELIKMKTSKESFESLARALGYLH